MPEAVQCLLVQCPLHNSPRLHQRVPYGMTDQTVGETGHMEGQHLAPAAVWTAVSYQTFSHNLQLHTAADSVKLFLKHQGAVKFWGFIIKTSEC